MKKLMLSWMLGILYLTSPAIQCEEIQHFGYGSLGSIGGYPTIGGGYRLHYGYQGFDISGKCFPIPTTGSIRGLFLIYPKQQGVYLGPGLGYLWEGETLRHGSISCDLVAGYQWQTAKGRPLFFQLEAMAPLTDTPFFPVWPGLTLGIGF